MNPRNVTKPSAGGNVTKDYFIGYVMGVAPPLDRNDDMGHISIIGSMHRRGFTLEDAIAHCLLSEECGFQGTEKEACDAMAVIDGRYPV